MAEAGPSLAPRSIVVIHGVGDHKEDETAKAFSRALAQARGSASMWAPPSLVIRTGDVQCEVAGAVAGESPGGAFTFSAYKIVVPWPSPNWEIPLYEFYWSNLSRKGLGLLGEVAKIWRFLVGPPRIGFQALTPPAAGRSDGFFLGCARLSYCLAWLLVIARLCASLALILLMGVFKVHFLRYFDIVFIFDLLIVFSLIAFALSRWSLAFCNPPAMRIARTAAQALAVSVLLTLAVPLTILEVTGFDIQFLRFPPWYHMGEAYDTWPGFGPSHFYAINSLPGFVMYFIYGLVVLWVIFGVGLQYGLVTLVVKYPAATDVESARATNPRRDIVDSRMRRFVTGSRAFLNVLSWLTVAVMPAVFCYEWLAILVRGSPLYLYDPEQASIMDVFVRSLTFSWVHFIAYLFIFLVWSVLTWPTLRRALAPAFELTFDVGAYFPPVPKAWSLQGLVDVITGRDLAVAPRVMEHQLAARLKTVIAYAHGQDPGPVAVIGHSLGSIIALTALKDGLIAADGSRLTADIYLVTIGSPLRLLRERFPHLYNPVRWSWWRLPGVRRWLNLYRAADPIGRDAGIRTDLDDVNISNGSHSRYFEDPDVATFLVNWLFPRMASNPVVPNPCRDGSDSPIVSRPTH